MEGLHTQDSVIEDLKLHLTMAHPNNISTQPHKVDKNETRPDRFPRPEIAEQASDTDWQFFIASWETYKRATQLSGQSACDQLWYCPSDSLKKKIFDAGIRPTNSESEILEGIKKLCVKAHNNMVNVMEFQNLYQRKSESINQYAARLNGAANICDFLVTCTCGKEANFAEKILTFQLIRGLQDCEIQERILAELASKDMTLLEVIKICEAVESGKRSSGALSRSGTLSRIYSEKGAKETKKKCAFCGEAWHTGPNWRASCKASTVSCNECGKKGHFGKMCRSKKIIKNSNNVLEEATTPQPEAEGENASMGFLFRLEAGGFRLSHVGVNEFGKWTKIKVDDHPEVDILIEPAVEGYKELKCPGKLPIKLTEIMEKGLVDTGAQMVVCGLSTVYAMGMKKSNLIPVGLKIKAADQGNMKLLGGILIKITGTDSNGNKRVSKQIAYVAENVNRVFLSRKACEDLGIVGQSFPRVGEFPAPTEQECFNQSVELVNKHNKACSSLISNCNCPVRELPPSPPSTCPYPPTPENIENLESWIRDHYKSSTFNTCNNQPLPLMGGSPPLELFIDKDARPVACHKPGRIPIHFKEEVEREIRRDVKLGVLEEVPPNTPTTWCSRMCVQTKKSGKPRRVIDLQPLNKHAVRQTYSGESPFDIVSEVPINTYKTTLDAWNGYHSVPIREEDRHFTTFVTPWGRFRYRTTPQGFLAAQDAYNHRFDLVVRDFQNKKRCVDDTLIWADTIEEMFHQTCQYLTLTGAAGIIMNPEKFNFAKRRIEFIGFELSETGVEPSREVLKAITDFPRPKDISGIRGWFGLVEQVAWAFSKTQLMAPFRHLLSPSAEFIWSDELEKAFISSKKKILEAVKDGVRTFDVEKKTCIATDWSKEGIGFCLLQKLCECEPVTPTCCKEGWKLILCRSRYTSPAESGYAPIEWECLAVAWALKKAKYFIAGCKSLTVAVDHKPLLGVLNDKSFDSIDNIRLAKLKEKIICFRFTIIHVPGVKNRIADIASRYPSVEPPSLVSEDNQRLTRTMVRRTRQNPDCVDIRDTDDLEGEIQATIASNLADLDQDVHESGAIGVEDVTRESRNDNVFVELKHLIRAGIKLRNANTEAEKIYQRYRHQLSEKDELIMYKNRVVIPESLRDKVLRILHSAHQGCSGMGLRASQVVWWPRIGEYIEEARNLCRSCDECAPSQARLPPIPPANPEFPMQLICSDIAHINGQSYVIITDRYTNWVSIYRANKASGLITALRNHFINFGAPEEITSDGGPEYTAFETLEFLRKWRVTHRLTSAYNPRANLRAELGVKVAKRLLRENMRNDGSLDNDKVGRALLTHRNPLVRN